MKKSLVICLILCMTALAGCGVPQAKPADQRKATSGVSPADQAKVVTVVGGVGIIETAMRQFVGPGFEKKTGIKVDYTPSPSNETISKVEIQGNAPKIDIMFLDPTVSGISAKKVLSEKVDKSAISNMSKMDERYVMVEGAIPIFGYVVAPAYNTEIFKKGNIAPIASWNDLIRSEYQGMTAFSDATADPGFTILYNLAMTNGGSLDNMEPGFEKAKALARNSNTFYKASPQIMAAVQQGAPVTVLQSYTIGQLVDSGLPLKMVIPKEGAPLQSVSANMVKNAPNKNAAIELVNYLLSEEVQEQLMNLSFYSVLKNKNVSPKYQESIGLKDTDKVYKPDIQKLSEIRPAALDRWKKEVAPELGKR